MITRDEFEKALKIVQEYQRQISSEYERIKRFAKNVVAIDTPVREFDLRVRTINILTGNDILTAGDLLNLDREKALRFRGCGNRMWTEIKELKETLIII